MEVEHTTTTVKVFADLRKLIASETSLPMASPRRIQDILQELSLPVEKVAVIFLNGRHAELSDEVSAGDTLSLFPPVGGG